MNFDAITRFAADGILNSFLAGIGIAMLAWAVNRLFSRQGSGTRFVVWLLALLAIGIVPFAGNLASTNAAPKITSPSVLALPQSFATYLFVAWIIGAALGLLHVAHGLYRLRRLRATCTPVDLDQLDATSRAILNEACAPPAGVTDDRRICACRSGLLPSVGDRVGIHRPVTLCTSNAVRVPAAIGYFRPMVVFPTWALSELPPAELNAILLHELAHLRRWDDFTNLAQKIVKAIFFFHPAVWFIESRLTLEREMACDDAVLAASFSPRAYAESLVGLAEKSFLRRGVQLAQAAVSHVQQLKLRLAEILRKDKTQQGSARIGKPAVALMSLIGIISFYGVAHAPRLVAFSSDDQQIASAPTIAEHAIANDVDAQLRPVTLRYTVRPSSTPRADVLKAHTSANKHGAPRVAKKNELRVLRASVVMPVSALQSRSDGGALVASGASRWIAMPNDLQAAERPTAAPVLVVFHAQQFSADGPIFWRVTIVHLTPAQQRAITGGIAKQI